MIILADKKANYGLFTTIAMIVGIVIGSGIFFKSNDILIFTGGNVALGVLVFCIGATSIIFGSLTLTELSMRTEKSGGVIGYYEDFISKKVACAFGWFQNFIYFPSFNAVITWVCGIYICSLFGINPKLENHVIVGLLVYLVISFFNIISVKFGSYFQNISTVIKLVPLIGIALAGFFLGDVHPAIPEGFNVITKSDVGLGFIAALTPAAFAYDGWIISTSISGDVKNPERTMPIALTVGPIIILVSYIVYFLGLNRLLGPEYIMSVGNYSISAAGELIFGPLGDKIMLIFVIISVLGVINGVTMGMIRLPQALASKNMIPCSDKIKKINPKYDLSLSSCVISVVSCIFWIFINYITQKNHLIHNGDVCGVAIVFSYVCYIVLYFKVMLMRKRNIVKSNFKGIVCPILAIVGALIIFVGGVVSDPSYVLTFLLICILFCLIGYFYYQKEGDNVNGN